MVEQIIEEVSDWDVSPELMVTANGDRWINGWRKIYRSCPGPAVKN
ncbi:hypothetical protein IQ218_09650 [Synechocystis salina LEGE 06099]|nr:hypothetical protein [Synechocystis salina LEGE 06099]